MTIELTVPFEMRALHEPALIARRPVPIQGSVFKDRSRQLLLFVMLGIVVGILLFAWAFGISIDLLLAFEAGAISMLLFLLFFVRRFWMAWFQRETAMSPISQTPMVIKLDENGVHVDNAVLRQTIVWPGILDVTQSTTATALWFTRSTLVVLPDHALPEGLARDDMIAAINSWRDAQ